MANTIVTRTELNPATIPAGSTYTIEPSVQVNTTTTFRPAGTVITNVGYIPYMRGQEIEFIGMRLRPNRQIHYYFDDHPISKYVERPNIIETTTRNPELKDLKTGNREIIVINGASAKVLCVETNENDGNSRIYVSHFTNPAAVHYGNNITSNTSAYAGAVKNYVHSSGAVQSGSQNSFILMSADANNSVDEFYTGYVITIVNGPNAGQSTEIISYNCATRTATVSPSFVNVKEGQIYSLGDPRSFYSSNNFQSMYVSPRGFTSGVFHLPDPSQSSLRIPTGDRIFRILDNGRNDVEQYTTKAEYRFVSNGLDLTKAQIIERTINTEIDNVLKYVIDPTPTPTPTLTPSATRTNSVTPTVTPSYTATATPTATATSTGTVTPSKTASVTLTPTETPPVTPTTTATPSVTLTTTTTPNPSSTPTKTVTPSATPPVTATPTYVPITPAVTPTRTYTPIPTRSYTPTYTRTRTIIPVPVTPPVTPTPTKTNTVTPSSVPSNPCSSYNTTSASSFKCAVLFSTNGNSGLLSKMGDRWRYVNADGTIIQGSPNALRTFKMGGAGTGRTMTGSDASLPDEHSNSNWFIGSVNGQPFNNSPNSTDPQAGVKFPNNTYLASYGAGSGWTGPFNVSNLYAYPVLCHQDVSSQCLHVPHDPTAQTFYVDTSTYPDGVFISSIDLFFKNKGDFPVEIQIRPVVNGAPSSNTVIPGAVAVLEAEDVKITELPNVSNSSTNTRFTFSSPVYLNSGYEYAMVLITDEYNYDVYIGELGKTALGSTDILSKQPFSGSLYKSQNQRTWTPIQDEDLMFRLNMCAFNDVGIAYLNEDRVKLPAVSSSNNVYDAFEVHSDAMEINNTKLNYYYKGRSNTTGYFDASYIGIRPEEKINLVERKVISSPSYVQTDFDMRVDMRTGNPAVSPVIYHNRQNLVAIENQINGTGLFSENFTIIDQGLDYAGNATVTITSPVGYGANAYAEVQNGLVVGIVVDNPGTGYVDNVTAVIDAPYTMGNAAQTVVTTETSASGGPAITRYISKTVTLVDGFDAGDLRVYVTAIKPAGANVQVYYKVRNSLDPQQIEDKNWTRFVQKTSEYIYSSDGNQIEYEYRPSLTSNNITYTTGSATYKTFNQYKLKIVLSANNTVSSALPYVYDIRAIALPEDAY